MPIYEYQCDTCDSIKEVLHKVLENIEVSCDNCGTEIAMHRILSASGFILNGAGFYQNDYKKPLPPTKGRDIGGKE